MPKFKVRVIAETTVYADVEVEALNEDDAEELALKKAKNGEVRYELSEGNALDWESEEVEKVTCVCGDPEDHVFVENCIPF